MYLLYETVVPGTPTMRRSHHTCRYLNFFTVAFLAVLRIHNTVDYIILSQACNIPMIWWSEPTSKHAFILSWISVVLTAGAAAAGLIFFMVRMLYWSSLEDFLDG